MGITPHQTSCLADADPQKFEPLVWLPLLLHPAPDCRDVQLGLRLLQEVKAGPQSKWHTWIQTLPKSFDTLIFWGDAELEDLQTGTMPAEQLQAQVSADDLLLHVKH